MKRKDCTNCGAFPCIGGMDQSGLKLVGRRLVPIRTTEKERRKYWADFIPKERGCDSHERVHQIQEVLVLT